MCVAVALLDAKIDALDAAIAHEIAADAELAHAARLMRSAPGVGPVTATQLLAPMPELGAIGPKSLAALAGLAPMNRDSGLHRGKRAIKSGRKRVRDALYMAALNAARRAGPLRSFYERLRAAAPPQARADHRGSKAAHHAQRQGQRPKTLCAARRNMTSPDRALTCTSG